MGIRIKRKPGSHNSCILSKQSTDHHEVSRGTNLLPSPFACRVKIKDFGGFLPERLAFRKRDRTRRHGESIRVQLCGNIYDHSQEVKSQSNS